MSAIHEYRYRQRNRHQENLNRIQSKTREFYDRYQQVMQDMRNQGLDQVVPEEYRQLTQELNRLNSLLSSNPVEAREMSTSLGDEVYGLRRLANKARGHVERQQCQDHQEERQLKEEKIQREETQADQLWQQLRAEFTDPVVRDFAFDGLSTLQAEYRNLSEEELRSRVKQIKVSAGQKSAIWKTEQRNSSQSETQLEVLEEHQQQVRKDLKGSPKKLQAILDNLQKNRDFLVDGGQLDQLELQQTLASQVEQADEAITDERCRQLTVKGIMDGLKHQGFQIQPPTLEGGEVLIEARRLSGRESKFWVGLDGAFKYKFHEYEGMACKDDIDELLPKLQDVYGIELSNKKVIWENPDRNLRSARSMEDPSERDNNV